MADGKRKLRYQSLHRIVQKTSMISEKLNLNIETAFSIIRFMKL